jgi:hypothetical protein
MEFLGYSLDLLRLYQVHEKIQRAGKKIENLLWEGASPPKGNSTIGRFSGIFGITACPPSLAANRFHSLR